MIDLISGKMGQPPGGFPLAVQRRILRDRPLVIGRPGESLLPADFTVAAEKVRNLIKSEPSNRDVVTWLLYPKVFEEFVAHQQLNSDTSCLPTPVFFYGQAPGEKFRLISNRVSASSFASFRSATRIPMANGPSFSNSTASLVMSRSSISPLSRKGPPTSRLMRPTTNISVPACRG